MATDKEERIIEILVKGQSATASIKEIGAAASVAKAQLDKMNQDDPGYAEKQRQYAELTQRYKERTTAARQVQKSEQELREEQEKNAKAALEVVVNGKRVNATWNDMDAAAKQLERDIRGLTPGTQEFISKSKELKGVKQRMEEVDKAVKGTEKSSLAAKLGFDGITSASGLMKAGFTAAMEALLPLLAVQQIWETVKAFIGLVDEVDKVKGAINAATGAQGEMLDTLYGKVQALSRTFGDDYADVLKAGDVLAKQMGISHAEAFDIIEKGYVAGANRSGEFLDNVKEYAVQFKDAGATAEDFVTIVTKAEQQGIFSDKGADTVKEFGLRIREQTTATRDALDAAFGQDFTNRIFAGINSGKMTVMESLSEVSKAMNDTSVPASKLQTVVADVFGGPGEDAGLAYLKTLHTIGDGLDGLIDKNNVYTQMVQEQLAANKQLAEAEARLTQTFSGTGNTLSTFWTRLKAETYNYLTDIINDFQRMGWELSGSGAAIKSWGTTVVTVFEAIKNRDWAGARQAFANIGSDSAKAYNDAYLQAMRETLAERQAAAAASKPAGAEVPGDVHGGDPSRQEQEAARKKAAADAEREAKRHAAELKKAREAAEKAELEATRNLEDLRISLIKDKYQREIEEINAQTNRKMEALAGDDEQIQAQWELLEQQRQERITAVREKQREDEKAERQRVIDEDLATRQEQEQQAEDERAATFALQFANALMSQAEYEQAMYDLKRQALENQLLLLKQAGKEETAEYKRLALSKIQIETDRVKKEKEQKQALRTFELQMQGAAAGLLTDSLGFLVDNLTKKRSAYEAFKGILKTAQIAEIGINLQAELQNNALNASNPMNPLAGIPGATAAQLALNNALSIGRAAIASIKVAAFAEGGPTNQLANVLSAGQLAGLLSGGRTPSRGSFAGGGPINAPTLGLIGEAGAELVIPNWLYTEPKLANLMGFLEAQIASRGNAFADGGPTAARPVLTVAQEEDGLGRLAELMEQMVSTQLQFQNEISRWQRELSVQQNLLEVSDGLKVVQKTQNGGGIR